MNHPHEQQAAAMERAGELTDGEQLAECINSGQVSAAQVVAHVEAGELPPLPKPDRPNIWGGCHSTEQMRAYATVALAAKQEEVVRLKEQLDKLRAQQGAST